MLPLTTRHVVLPPERMALVLALLGQNTPESRLRAAQILALGYALDEDSRLAALPPDDRVAEVPAALR